MSAAAAWKWSYGEPPIRSTPRPEKAPEPPALRDEQNNIEPARNPHSQAIEDAQTANMAINYQFLGLEQQQTQGRNNSREAVNAKLGQREMLPAVGGNPYLAQNNYIRDLQVQSQFLMPQAQYRRDNK